jgi:hypothetical protein
MAIQIYNYEYKNTGMIIQGVYVKLKIVSHNSKETISDVIYFFNKEKSDNGFNPFDVKQIYVKENLDLSIKNTGKTLLEIVYDKVKSEFFSGTKIEDV